MPVNLPPIPTGNLTAKTAAEKAATVTGYVDIKFIPFLMALGVVSIPIAYLKTTGQHDWVWKYILLIVLSLVVYYEKGISRFAAYMNNLQKTV